jgi:ParB family chromosome partitioning protein
MAEKKTTRKKTAGAPRRRRKQAGASIAITASESAAGAAPEEVREIEKQVVHDGGAVLGVYREPYGGRWLLLTALPIDQVEPTPFQRNLSDAHVRKLEGVVSKLGRFLDPIIAVRTDKTTDGKGLYWTPNGFHRLSAMRSLGAKAIVAILVPEAGAAYQILALNTEKAHNLRERALEVIRMYKELARLDDATEEKYALEFEEGALITLGLCYEERPRFSGGAYHPVLRRVDQFLKRGLGDALEIRRARARAVMELDDLIVEKVEALKSKGLTSPYLKSFVVARVNPIRFRPKDAALLGFDEAVERMMKAAAKLDPERIRITDLARSGGAPDETD